MLSFKKSRFQFDNHELMCSATKIKGLSVHHLHYFGLLHDEFALLVFLPLLKGFLLARKK